ncbi:ExbD/TolR family protein [Pectobacterium sp. B2J-2]|uniref:ExbD/TolR family protein n=1 Tax=Pectobacterium sp. B2J-2 TaxID=3385372 RepID=UPI0038FCE539
MALKTIKKRQEPQVMIEINTTPLIDVMLVLLIMLIITIPVQLHSVKLDLPIATDTPPPQEKPQVVSIRIEPDSTILWDRQPVALEQLETRLEAIARLADTPELHIRPDRAANYGTVVAVMAAIQRHGLEKIGLEGAEQFEP